MEVNYHLLNDINNSGKFTESSCIIEALFGSLGSRRDSAAHFPNFFISFSPDAPIHAIASICLRPLKREKTAHLIQHN